MGILESSDQLTFPDASTNNVLVTSVSYGRSLSLQEVLQDPWVGITQVPMEILLSASQ